jgi:hypothetical protein
MSGYVEAGYSVVLVTLAGYTVSLLCRERAVRRRLARGAGGGETQPVQAPPATPPPSPPRDTASADESRAGFLP